MLDDNLSENSLNLPEGWIVCKSVKKNPDRVYYFNIINGEKSWEPPNQDGTKRKKKKKKSHSDTSSELKKSSQFDKSPGFEDKSWESTSSTTVGELLFSRTPPVRNKASQITEWLSGLGSPEFKKKSDSQDFKINSLSGLESAKFKDKFKVNKQQYDATNAKRKRKSCDNSQLTYDLPQATSQGYVSNNPRSSQFVHPVSPPVKSKKLRTAEAELQKDTISVKPVSNDSYKIKRLSQETAVIPVKHYSSHSTVRNNEAVSSLDPRRRQNKPDSSICHRDNSTASRSKHEINPTFSTSEFYPSICQSPPDACATNITAENSPKKKKKRAWKRKKKRSDSADFQKKVTLSRNTSIPVYRATSTDKCMKDSHTKPDAKTQEIIQSKKLKHCSMNETIVQLHTSERFASQDKRNKLITSKNLKPSRRSNTTSVDSSITRSDQINNNKSSDAVKSPKKAQMPNIEKHSHAFEKSAIKKRVVCDVKPIMISECKTPKSRERSRTCVSPDSTFQEKKPSSVVEKSESTPVVVSSTCIRKESNEVNKNDKRDSESDSQMDVSTESAPLSYFAGPNLNDFSEVVDMDVDNEDHLMSQKYGKLTALNMIDSTTTCSSSIEQNMLYVVLDTNVLINHLKFLEEFKDQDIKGCGRPVLVIPWVVMQELDSLKDSKNIRHDTDYNINRKARAAVKFLHLCFESRHPRVKGQSMTEGSTKLPTVNIESNDDRVLQCCILYQQKVDAEVILFTNDKNLCNKAISSDVQAFTKESLLKGIRELFGVDIVSPVRIKKSNTNANQSKTSTQDTKSAKLNTAQTKEQKLKEFADDILCKLKARLREALSVVLETEMKNAFGDIWLSIVLIKPPWTMKDLIDCYNKHWIAVFGLIVKRNVKEYLEVLLEHYKTRAGFGLSVRQAIHVVYNGLQFLKAFHNHDSYDGKISDAVDVIQSLHDKCTQVVDGAMTLEEACGEVSTSNQCSANFTSENSPAKHVMEVFEVIWRAVNYYTALIFEALEYTHPLFPSVHASEKPTGAQAVILLATLCRQVHMLCNVLLNNIVNIEIQTLLKRKDLLEQVCEAIFTFIQNVPINGMNCKITPEMLQEFIMCSNNRQSLIVGQKQLNSVLEHLQNCYVNI